jgi:hypothetical protein
MPASFLDSARATALNWCMTANQRALDCRARAVEAHRRAMEHVTSAEHQRWLEIAQTWNCMARAFEDAADLEACLAAAIAENSAVVLSMSPEIAPEIAPEIVPGNVSDPLETSTASEQDEERAETLIEADEQPEALLRHDQG